MGTLLGCSFVSEHTSGTGARACLTFFGLGRKAIKLLAANWASDGISAFRHENLKLDYAGNATTSGVKVEQNQHNRG